MEIRRCIRLRWPGTRTEGRRDVATALVILGTAGLRREEARLLRTGDVRLDDWQGVIVQPSEDHTLKSDCSKRKLPAEVFPPEDFGFLRALCGSRPKSVKSQNGWLLGCEEFECISPGIFISLNEIISGVTGTSSDAHPTHYHHLRKSFCSYALLRLLLPAGCEVPDYMSKADRNWLVAGKNLRPQNIRRTVQPWNSDVFLMGQLLGHLHGRTTMSRYFHFCGELLRIYLSRSAELSPVAEQLGLAVGIRSHSGDYRCDAQFAMRSAVSLLGDMARSRGIVPPAMGARLNNKGRTYLTEILDAWDLLSLLELLDAKSDLADAKVLQAAADVRMDATRAKAIVKAASYLSTLTSGNGEFRHRFVEFTSRKSGPTTIRSVIPVRPNWDSDNEIIKRFAPRIEALRGRSLLTEGLNSFVEYMWDSEGCPVFANPTKDGEAAKTFLKLLYKLEIADKEIRYGSFDRNRSASRTEWKLALELRLRRPFERWRVPFGDDDSVRPWLGIKPTFGPEAQTQS